MRFLLVLALLVSAKPVFETKSKFSHITVEERDGIRHLMFDRVTQSSGRIGQPKVLIHDYTQTSMLGMGLVPESGRVLVIGLGGGSMPMFIRAHWPKTMIDVVEIDPTVVEIAERYFGFRQDPLLKVHVEDGALFVDRVQQLYDLVILDAYAPDFIPPQLSTPAFFGLMKDKLTNGGVLVTNVWGPPNPHYDAMVKTQKAAFSHLAIVKARNSGNHIFIAREKPVEKADLLSAARTLQKKYAFHFDLAEVVERGYVKP